MPASNLKRYSRAIVDAVSIGHAPKKCKAASGKFFEIGTMERPMKHLKRHRVTNFEVSLDADKPQSVPDMRLFQGFDQMMAEITEQVTRNLLKEKGDLIVQYASRFSRRGYCNMVIIRLFAECVNTVDGRASNKKATKALKGKLDNETISDFVTESKAIYRRLQKAKQDRDEKAEMDLSLKLEIVKDVASEHLGPCLPGDGYVDVLTAIALANEAVHETFDEEELHAVQTEATSMCSGKGAEWIKFLAEDLRIRMKSKN